MRSLAVAQRARQYLEQGCVIVDFETTGFVSPTVDIVEIAVIDQDGQVLLDTLVKPSGRIPYRASLVHGIYDDDVKNAPTFDEVYAVFRNVVSSQPLAIAYNDEFERGILRSVCMRYAQPVPPLEWQCAMRAYMSYAQQYKFSKLGDACAREGVHVDNAHRALGDCVMTLHLLNKMAAYTEETHNEQASINTATETPMHRSAARRYSYRRYRS
jgi:DNA polymerase-3 subunit epsilon